MPKIFVCSDIHFCHNRGFLFEPRGFNSIEDHDNEIIKRWNEIIAENDTVYILGDIMLNDNEKGIEYFNKLNGFKHIILGNHDTDTRKKLYEEAHNVLSVQYATVIKHKGYHFYLSHYPTVTSNLEKESLKQCMINLFGHTHSKDKFYNDIPYMYNVALDAHNCTPIDIDTIIEDCKAKVTECKEML